MNVDAQTKARLHEMGAAELVRSFEAQGGSVCTGMAFADGLQAAVDEACSQFVTDKVSGLTKRAKLRYPEADIRKLELVEGRKLNRALVAELASCGSMGRCDSLVLMGFSGTGKTHFACALGKEACRRRMRTLYIRVPDLEEPRRAQVEKEGGDTKLVRKLANHQALILDERLLTKPECGFRNFLLEVTGRRHKEVSTMFGTQCQRKDWCARLGSDVTAEAIMDRIVHNATWMELGDINMRERLSGRKDG